MKRWGMPAVSLPQQRGPAGVRANVLAWRCPRPRAGAAPAVPTCPASSQGAEAPHRLLMAQDVNVPFQQNPSSDCV